MPLKINVFITGPFEVNSYLIIEEDNNQAIIVDPGHSPFELIEYIDSMQITPRFVLNTHGHMDHIGGNKEICEEYDIGVYIGAEDAPMLTDPSLNLSAYLDTPVVSPAAYKLLSEGDDIVLGEHSFRVVETPGHTRGSVSIFNHDFVICGDVLFLQSIGRTDFPGSDHNTLLASIKNKLLTLPGSTRVLSGHGPETTIANEIKHNPFLSAL